MRRFTVTAMAVLFMGTFVACGDDDEATPAVTPPAENATENGNTDPDPSDDGGESNGENGGAPAGGAGTVSANGETYSFNQIMNCEPPEGVVPQSEPILSVSALGDEADVHVRVTEAAGRTFHDLDFYGADGAYNGGASSGPSGWSDAVDVVTPESPLTITEDRITGSLTVVNTRATDETIDIEVDIPYPVDTRDC